MSKSVETYVTQLAKQKFLVYRPIAKIINEVRANAKKFHAAERSWTRAKYRLAAMVLEQYEGFGLVCFQDATAFDDNDVAYRHSPDLMFDAVRRYVTDNFYTALIWADAIDYARDSGVTPEGLATFLEREGGIAACAARHRTRRIAKIVTQPNPNSTDRKSHRKKSRVSPQSTSRPGPPSEERPR